MTAMRRLSKVRDAIQRAGERLVEAFYGLEALRTAEAHLEDRVLAEMGHHEGTTVAIAADGSASIVVFPPKSGG